jgi:uncharacterized membrane protein
MNLDRPLRRRNRLAERLRAWFIAGILVVGPIAFTLYLIWLFIHSIDGLVAALLPEQYNPETYLPNVPGFGLLIGVIVLTLLGALTAGYLGRLVLRVSERVVARMPVVRGIYSAVKQIFETVLASQSDTFREVVLVEYPRAGMWTVAFVTVKPEGLIAAQSGPDAVAIYVPTTPNPTSGFLVFVPRRDLVTLPMTVEEGIKFVISCGIVAPPDRRALAPAEAAAEPPRENYPDRTNRTA